MNQDDQPASRVVVEDFEPPFVRASQLNVHEIRIPGSMEVGAAGPYVTC